MLACAFLVVSASLVEDVGQVRFLEKHTLVSLSLLGDPRMELY